MYNPISGLGRAAAAAAELARVLESSGHQAVTLPSRLEPTSQWLEPVLCGRACQDAKVGCKGVEGAAPARQVDASAPRHPEAVDLLVVAGGDGAMRMAAPAACRCGTAVYHLPFGTENLFAREFGMDRNPRTLLDAIQRWRIRSVDVGVANGRWFLLMASVGFDAEVVHTLAQSRGQSISHLTYVRPILASMRAWQPPVLDVEVDGVRVVSAMPGMVVIANSRQYGWRIDPAARADMSDGLLDVLFMPAGSMINVLAWAARCRLRRQYRHRRLTQVRGRHVIVRSDRAQHFQLDGDPPGVVHELLPEGLDAAALAAHQPTEDQSGRPLELCVNICPGLLRVLTAK